MDPRYILINKKKKKKQLSEQNYVKFYMKMYFNLF